MRAYLYVKQAFYIHVALWGIVKQAFGRMYEGNKEEKVDLGPTGLFLRGGVDELSFVGSFAEPSR